MIGPPATASWSSLLLGSLLVATGLGIGCDRAERAGTAEDIADRGPSEMLPSMSPGTMRALGPHIFEATLDVAADHRGVYAARDTGVRLAWAELDHYSFREVDSGRLVREEVRIGADLYRRASETGPYHRLGGIPGDSLILHRTITLWASALAPFARQIAFDPQPDSTIEGRPVRVWRVTLAPLPAPGLDSHGSPEFAAAMLERAPKVLRLSGSVYVDVETGNRLLAELEGRFVVRSSPDEHEPTDEVHVEYRERRVLLDVPEDVVRPSPDSIRQRKIAPPPFHVGPGRIPPRGRGRG